MIKWIRRKIEKRRAIWVGNYLAKEFLKNPGHAWVLKFAIDGWIEEHSDLPPEEIGEYLEVYNRCVADVKSSKELK